MRDERIRRLDAALEGEADGLALPEESLKSILAHLDGPVIDGFKFEALIDDLSTSIRRVPNPPITDTVIAYESCRQICDVVLAHRARGGPLAPAEIEQVLFNLKLVRKSLGALEYYSRRLSFEVADIQKKSEEVAADLEELVRIYG